ncbi:hypothetical protein LIER_11636 [Lithospermum erythrorhizon]|uniref:Uncharacterized protein n=1 Tax=Lithospermum erythrorhizon TaxID=34254 RepID=A0AAV3PQS6_LITER
MNTYGSSTPEGLINCSDFPVQKLMASLQGMNRTNKKLNTVGNHRHLGKRRLIPLQYPAGSCAVNKMMISMREKLSVIQRLG